MPIPVPERSKARVCGRSLAGNAGLNPAEVWMFVCCECCVLSGKGLSDGPIPRSEDSYRLWCVTVCDLQISSMKWPWPALGCFARKNKVKYAELIPVLN